MNDHCLHTKSVLAIPDAFICCRCLQMASTESVVKRMKCLIEKYRVHDAAEWHDSWKQRES